MGIRKRTTCTVVVLLSILGLGISGCQKPVEIAESPPLPTTPPPIQIIDIDPAEYLTVRVTEVAEGDIFSAIDAYGQDAGVRLHGVDCPELRQPFGPDAAKFTRKLCVGEYVQLRLFGTDTGGRHVAVVTLPNGDNLNEKLVEAGYAHWFREYVPGDERLAYFEAKAKQDRRGLWADVEPVPPWEYRSGKQTPPASPRIARTQPSRQIRSTTPSASRPPAPTQRPSAGISGYSKETVYVADNGEKYHRESCQYLSRSKRPMPLTQAKQRHTACSKCRPPQ